MKQKILVLVLTLTSLFFALSCISSDGPIRADSKSNQDNARKGEPAKLVYDIDGKRLRADEKYIAERTLKNGRIVAYRKNKRDIAALVKALKEDGITDEKLLDPQAWNMQICFNTSGYGCNGGCGGGTCKNIHGNPNRVNPGHVSTLEYCNCVQ